MATYSYRCRADGLHDLQAPIGTAPATLDCPLCGESSPRAITAPMLGLADRTRMSLIDSTTASASDPRVVTSVPGRASSATPPRLDPRTSRLPRP